MTKYELRCGDCLEVMQGMADNSVDTIITDPPYGLSFMGKKWDYQVPSIEIWKEALRVLKPGGTALIFAGSRTQHRMAVNVEDAGFILKDCIMWIYGSGFPKATDISKQLDKKAGEITIPTTPAAKLWNGWKSHGLKPAYEPILVAMKPNEGSYAENAIKHGVAGLNIDAGRIGKNAGWSYPNGRQGKGCFGKESLELNLKEPITSTQGRYPANIILDEEVADEAGDWSRYFYCAKSSKAERNLGCEGMEEKQTNGGRKNQDSINCPQQRGITYRKNHHPTVKPLSLMEYLCKLTSTPTGGLVLDPFAGSGTTGVACVKTSRNFIGIELNPEYIEIAKKRIEKALLDKRNILMRTCPICGFQFNSSTQSHCGRSRCKASLMDRMNARLNKRMVEKIKTKPKKLSVREQLDVL